MASTMLSSTRLAQRTGPCTAAPRPALRAVQVTRPAALRQVIARAEPKVCSRATSSAVAALSQALPLQGPFLTVVAFVWQSAVETAIENAKNTCESGSVGECAADWDEMSLPDTLKDL